MTGTDSFPRRQARTQRFTLGEPRNIEVSSDGSRVSFLRSSGPFDPVNALWVLDVASGIERLVADPRRLENSAAGTGAACGGAVAGAAVDASVECVVGGGAVAGAVGGGVPAAERARRERVRESAAGIVSYSTDIALTAAVFALDGCLWRVGLLRGSGPAERLEARPGAFDPCMSPDGRRVAYVSGPTLRVTGDGGGDRVGGGAHSISDSRRAGHSEDSQPERPPASPHSISDSRRAGHAGDGGRDRVVDGAGAGVGGGMPEGIIARNIDGVVDGGAGGVGGGAGVGDVVGGGVRGGGGDRAVAAEPDGTVSWGSAEFVAAEEMGRTRGHWWSPDSRRLLAARVDTGSVPAWWISSPASPDDEPVEVRYSAAGEANASVALAVFDVGGADGPECVGGVGGPEGVGGVGGGPGRVDVAWTEGGWEYLAAVAWSIEGLLLTVQSRDQRTLGVLAADPDSGACRLLRLVTDDAWVELVPGAPRLVGGRLVTVEDRGATRSLCVDGEPLTPPEVQVRAVQHADDDAVVLTASTEPADTHVARLRWDGSLQWLTSGPGVHSSVVGGDTTVIVSRSLDHPGRRCTVTSPLFRSVVSSSASASSDGPASSSASDDLPAPSSPAASGAPASPSSQVPGAAVCQRHPCGLPASSDSTAPTALGIPLVLTSHAARPGLELNVEIVELGPRRLVSAVVMPADMPAGGGGTLPVLLDPYGGPHAQRVQRAEALFHTPQWFADAGFAVLIVDGRGTPGRGPAFERAVRGDLAGPALQDQVDALHDAAGRYPRLDLSRVAVRGWSFGGYLAALAVLRRPDVFSAAVAGAPVTDWRLYDTHYTERYLGHPAEEPANYDRTALAPLAPRLRRPLLLIHGLADDNVVAAHTLRLSQALTEAGRPHSMLPLPGITHMTPQEKVAENLLLLQLHFLQDALGMKRS